MHFVDEAIQTEIEAGRMAGPFTREEVESALGFFRTNPIGLVDKSTPPGQAPKKRLIEDISYPRQPPEGEVQSINSYLDPDSFPCQWSTFATTRLFMQRAAASKATEVFGFDIQKAFHHLPLHPTVRRFLCLEWRGGFFIRGAAPFGACTTPAVFEQVMDASVDLCRAHFGGRVDANNYVDDLVVAVFDPSVAEAEVCEYWQVNLGWTSEDTKKQRRGRRIRHVGADWDLDTGLVSVPTEKKIKYRSRIQAALDKAETKPPTSLQKKDFESLLGVLQYVSFIIPSSRSHLRTLYLFGRSYPPDNIHKARTMYEREVKCLRWWYELLDPAKDLSASFVSPPNHFRPRIHCDASNKAIGIHVTKIEDGVRVVWTSAKRLVDDWRTRFQSTAEIFDAEAWGVEWAVEAAVRMGARACSLTIDTDNESFALAWRKGWSSAPFLNAAIERLNMVAIRFDLYINLHWIPSEQNLADAVSRLEPVPEASPFPAFLSTPIGTEGGPDPSTRSGWWEHCE